MGSTLDFAIAGCEMNLLAKDGIYIRDYPRKITRAQIPGGGRADFMIRCPEPGNYLIQLSNFITLATVIASGDKIPSEHLVPWVPDFPEYLPDL